MKRLAPLALLAGCTSITGTQPDANPPGCLAPTVYDPAIATEQHAEAADGFVNLLGALSPFEVFSLELYGDDLTTGAHAVGDQYATCEVCVLVYAGFDDGAIGATYLATSGNVTINSLAPRLSGAVSDLTLVHVDLQVDLDDQLRSSPSMDGCVTAVTSLIFDAEVAR